MRCVPWLQHRDEAAPTIGGKVDGQAARKHEQRRARIVVAHHMGLNKSSTDEMLGGAGAAHLFGTSSDRKVEAL
jgi:hypothetical protein